MIEKVTIYRSGIFGIIKTEAKSLEYGRRKHAQHDNTLFVRYIAKRKRNSEFFIGGDHPFFLILRGWGHPEPQSEWVPGYHAGTLETRYPSCDLRYLTDFNRDIADHLKTAEVIADHRHTIDQSPRLRSK